MAAIFSATKFPQLTGMATSSLFYSSSWQRLPDALESPSFFSSGKISCNWPLWLFFKNLGSLGELIHLRAGPRNKFTSISISAMYKLPT
jgi:hypothetical protein